MRQIGTTLPNELAQRFADFLRSKGAACTVDQTAEGSRVWVHDDDHVELARTELPRFLADPNNEQYQQAAKLVMDKIREDAARLKAARARTVNMSERWQRPAFQACPLTHILIAISVLVGVATQLSPRPTDEILGHLWFSNDGTLSAIQHGEIWRLVTPIFLHLGPIHLLFNMLWLRQFGMQIEAPRGTLRFAAMVLAIAVISNFAEFYFGSKFFGGMSGVVYGLFGYIWVRGKLEPDTGFWLPQQTIIMMLVWHVLCVLELIPHVANWAHGGGLVTGIALAFGSHFVRTITRGR